MYIYLILETTFFENISSFPWIEDVLHMYHIVAYNYYLNQFLMFGQFSLWGFNNLATS